MARYRMSDGMVVDTDNASARWNEDRYYDGRNFISRATGGQWDHEALYRSRRGRYYLESWSDWEGTHESAEWISKEEAARWLMLNNHDLPGDLKEVGDQVID